MGAIISVLGAVLACPRWEISGLPVNAALRQFLEPTKQMAGIEGECMGAAHNL